MAKKTAAEEPASELIGTKAPAFALPDQDGHVHKLADYKGQYVVLYAYPKDDTPGFVFTHENRIAA
jgi:peroxiredoxin